MDAILRDTRARVLEVFGPNSIELAQTPPTLSTGLAGRRDWSYQLGVRIARECESLTRLIQRLEQKMALATSDYTNDDGATYVRFTCFLGYSFTDPRAERYAGLVQRFLAQIEVDVITGRDYEPRGITEKVRARLQRADFGVTIITAGTSTLWCRDELSNLHSRGRSVIPLLEEGAEFPPGIFGDHEWIRFDRDHIGDAFLPLLEGLNFIERRQWDAVDESASSHPPDRATEA